MQGIKWQNLVIYPRIKTWFAGNMVWSGLHVELYWHNPDSKVHGANMGPTWGRQDPGGPRVGPMNFAIWGCIKTRRIPTISFDQSLRYIPQVHKEVAHRCYLKRKPVELRYQRGPMLHDVTYRADKIKPEKLNLWKKSPLKHARF